jgi:pimeloyl-ACP methyl ester carboxylesterase
LAFLSLKRSALAPGISPVTIHYRNFGKGFPLLFLHSGWGYAIYPFDRQIAELERDFAITNPDRSGYGRSTRLTRFPASLHAAGAEETLAVLDALCIDKSVLWGHSDGAVIAARIALDAPHRAPGRCDGSDSLRQTQTEIARFLCRYGNESVSLPSIHNQDIRGGSR